MVSGGDVGSGLVTAYKVTPRTAAITTRTIIALNFKNMLLC